MRKIPTLFQRDWEGNKSLVTQEVNPECQWVVDGEGTASRKWDGTACLIRAGVLYKRYDAKVLPQEKFHQGEKVVKQRPPNPVPENFIPAQEPDFITGHYPGWVPVGDGPEDQYYREALLNLVNWPVDYMDVDSTYELVGPKLQGNPEDYSCHLFLAHGSCVIENAPKDYEELKLFLQENSMEGLVFHHPDSRMCKVKSKDLGISWPAKENKQ